MILELRSLNFFHSKSEYLVKSLFLTYKKNSGIGMGRVMPIPIPIPVPALYPFLAYPSHTYFFKFFIPISTINGASFSSLGTTPIPRQDLYFFNKWCTCVLRFWWTHFLLNSLFEFQLCKLNRIIWSIQSFTQTSISLWSKNLLELLYIWINLTCELYH